MADRLVPRISRTCLAVLAILPLIVGCGPSGPSDGDVDSSQLQQLARWYGNFPTVNRGRMPGDEAQLKAHITQHAGDSVASVDDLFVSERDGQPYVMLYGKDAANPGNGGVVGYEALGVEGKRFVGFRSGEVQELDEARIRQLVPQASF